MRKIDKQNNRGSGVPPRWGRIAVARTFVVILSEAKNLRVFTTNETLRCAQGDRLGEGFSGGFGSAPQKVASGTPLLRVVLLAVAIGMIPLASGCVVIRPDVVENNPATPKGAKPPSVQSQPEPIPAQEFFVAVSVVPGNWIADMETDLKNIALIADTIFVSCGSTRNFQETKLKPTLDAAHRHGLKAVLCYYRITEGSTSMDELAKNFGNHPAVVGFKVKDELGKLGESADYWLDYLKQARTVIRKHCDKPIMVDIIPWEFWSAGNATYEKKYPAAKNEAIDRYVEAGVLDWMIVSVWDKIPEMMPKAQARWGGKVKLVVRTSAAFVGDSFEGGSFKRNVAQNRVEKEREVERVVARLHEARDANAIGIHYYTWQHADYRILDKNGKSNPLFEAMKKNFVELKK
jgi:hypothetical protein